MKRKAYEYLLSWKNNRTRKPLLLQGARQVGKTYLVNEFAQKEYSQYHYFNFEKTPDLTSIFKGSLDPDQIITKLSLYKEEKINSNETLIFFDEIQVCPEAIISLKYFCESAPKYHIIAAGSLLGVSTGIGRSFPVGKVNFMTLFPMSFTEFLAAFGNNMLSDLILDGKYDDIHEVIHIKLVEKLKLYLFLGGMPEVLQSYLDEKDIVKSRNIQKDILKAYKNDFSKYSDSSQSIKTADVWDSIPYRLSKENKKFKFSDAKKNARSSSHEISITWLKNAGLIYPAYNISVPKLPLSGYSDRSKFKIYMLDTGLLGAILGLTSDIILKPDELFSEYNGAFIESFVASELMNSGSDELYYWTSEGKAEVDFIIRYDNRIFPIEVKSGTSRNLKSLRVYEKLYKPEKVIRISPRIYSREKEFINFPLYGVAGLEKMLKGNS